MINTEEIIDKCCICEGHIKTVYELPFEDIIGMANSYTQKLGMCPKCGYIFTQNPFPAEKLEYRYKNESKFEFDADDHIQHENIEYMLRCKRIKTFIQDYIDDTPSVLEIGAASGYNLSLYKEGGVEGIEPSALNCKLAEKNYGIKMFNGSFREYIEAGTDKQYDLIFLSMILEHIVNPLIFLKQVKNFNKRYMFIEVPTLDIKNTDEPFGMFCEEHVSMFTFESLNNMMQKLGYGLVDARIEMGFDKGYPAGWPCIDSIWEIDRRPVKFVPSISSATIVRPDRAYGKSRMVLPHKVS